LARRARARPSPSSRKPQAQALRGRHPARHAVPTKLINQWIRADQWTAFPIAAETPSWVSILLAAVAGFVDACTFLGLFGFFVAQVTGSSVIAGAYSVTGSPGTAVLLAVPVFFAGGIAATLAAVAAPRAGGRARARNSAVDRPYRDVCGQQPFWRGDAGRGRLDVRPRRYGRAERIGVVADARRSFDQRHDPHHKPNCPRCHAAGLGAAVSRRVGRDCSTARASPAAAVERPAAAARLPARNRCGRGCVRERRLSGADGAGSPGWRTHLLGRSTLRRNGDAGSAMMRGGRRDSPRSGSRPYLEAARG